MSSEGCSCGGSFLYCQVLKFQINGSTLFLCFLLVLWGCLLGWMGVYNIVGSNLSCGF